MPQKLTTMIKKQIFVIAHMNMSESDLQLENWLLYELYGRKLNPRLPLVVIATKSKQNIKTRFLSYFANSFIYARRN